MKNNQIEYDKIITILLSIVIITFFIPIDLVKNISIAVLFIASLFSGNLISKLRNIYKSPIILLFILFYFLHFIGLIYSENIKYGFFNLEVRSAFIVFPIIMYLIKPNKSEIKKQSILFATSTFVVAVLGLLYRTYFYFFQWKDTGFFYNDNLINIFGFQAVYYAIYVNFAIFIFIYHISIGSFKNKNIKILIYFIIAFLFVFNFLLASRISILSLYIISGFLLIKYLLQKKNIILNIGIGISFLLLLLAMFSLFPKTVKRFKSVTNSEFSFTNKNPINHFNGNISNNNWNGLNTRLAIWTCALEEIEERPVLGSGTGDFLDDLHNRFKTNKFYFGLESKYGTHNQFLQFLLMFGIIGFLFLLIFMLYPLFLALKHKNTLYSIFIILFLFAMLTEDVFSRNQGVILFSFFSGLFGFNYKRKSISKLFNDYKILTENIDTEYYSKYFLFPFFVSTNIASIHYLLLGYKKRYNPNKKFNTHYYSTKYKDVKEVGVNPFVHYIEFGKTEKRNIWFEDEIEYFELIKEFKCTETGGIVKQYFDKTEYKHQLKRSKFLFLKSLFLIHYKYKGNKDNLSPTPIFTPSDNMVNITFEEFLTGLKTNKFIGINIQSSYSKWIIENENNEEKKINNIIKKFKYNPLISIIIPVYNADINYLEQAIYSVKNQYYENWEICIADDKSTNKKLLSYLKEISKDKKIKIKFRAKNGHISACSNSALELAKGEFIALLDQDDLLSKNALFEIVKKLNFNKKLDLIFSNEDKVDEENIRNSPYFKNGWNYHLLLSQNYVSHLGVYRKSIIDKIGGFRLGFEGSQDYDLLLRFIEQIKENKIAFVDKILYHWRAIKGSTALDIDEKNYAVDAGIEALQEHLDRTKQNAIAIKASLPLYYRVKRKITGNPLVSIIIPTRNYVKDLKIAVNSVLNKNNYKNFEIIIVDNDSDDTETLKYFKEISKNKKVKILKYAGEFNFSAINNYAAKQSKGELLLFLNNDIEAIDEYWLEELISQIQPKDVAITGAKLLYPDNTIQHAGVEIGLGGVAGHSFKDKDKNSVAFFGRLQLIQNYDAVTAACLLIKKDVFNKVGGLDEKNLKVAFNDVDLCLKVRAINKKIVYCPNAELYHYESKSRGSDLDGEKNKRFKKEVEFMINKWHMKAYIYENNFKVYQ